MYISETTFDKGSCVETERTNLLLCCGSKEWMQTLGMKEKIAVTKKSGGGVKVKALLNAIVDLF